MGAVPGGSPGQPVGHHRRRVLVRAPRRPAPPGLLAAGILLDRHRRGGPWPLGHHGVAVGLGDDPLHVGQHVVASDRELARVGPYRLVLHDGDGDHAVTLQASALTYNPDMIWGGHGLMGLLDALVDLPGRRLVAGDPLVSAAHLCITQPGLDHAPPRSSTPRWSSPRLKEPDRLATPMGPWGIDRCDSAARPLRHTLC